MNLIPYPKSHLITQAKKWMESSLVKINEKVLSSLSLENFFEEDFEKNTFATAWEKEKAFTNQAQKIIAQNAINFMFWDTRDGQFYRYHHQGKTGALAMFEAFDKAWNDPFSPLFKTRHTDMMLKASDITTIFGDLPKPQTRALVLNEVLSAYIPVLEEKPLFKLSQLAYHMASNNQPFDTSFAYTLSRAFPLSFEDGLLKKAQLATSMLQKLAQSFGYNCPVSLTAFADYQVPNVLRHHNVLVYSNDLAQRIDHQQLLSPNSQEERAIRACCVLAVEEISRNTGLPSSAIDYWIWYHRHLPQTPFHLTKTTLY